MIITIGKTEIETPEAILEVMSDEQLESRILEVVNAELGYQNDRGVKALAAEEESALENAFLSARDTDTKADILAAKNAAIEALKPASADTIGKAKPVVKP